MQAREDPARRAAGGLRKVESKRVARASFWNGRLAELGILVYRCAGDERLRRAFFLNSQVVFRIGGFMRWLMFAGITLFAAGCQTPDERGSSGQTCSEDP